MWHRLHTFVLAFGNSVGRLWADKIYVVVAGICGLSYDEH